MKPILQVALDFSELSRAMKAAKEAVAGGVDWIEAGTPLIKSEGLEAVRALRRQFPKHSIVADLKTMDTGRFEVELAAKAGAAIASVMGAASPHTIEECIEAGRNYGIFISVDLLEVPNPVERAQLAERLGAYCASIHIPIDEQMRGRGPFDLVREVRSKTMIPLAVAGGLTSETVSQALEAGADILIVGGAITKAENATEAAALIRRAMDERQAIPSVWFKKFKEGEIYEALVKVSTPNLSDALHRGGVIEGIPQVSTRNKIVGRVLTVRTAPGDWAKPVEAIDQAEEGDIIVIDAGGRGPAVWGELATWSALNRKVAGVVIDGGIRDIDEIRRLEFPAFARLVMPNAGEPKGFGEINVPLKIGGQVVEPGDWVVGDENGLVRISKQNLVEAANRALDVLERENRIRQEIKEGSSLAQVMELLRWEKTLG